MAALEAAVVALGRGDLVAYPTETVYGLGADATDGPAVERVFALKGREREKPLSVAVGSVADATRCFDLTDAERRFLDAFCPGPVTLVCSRPDTISPVVTGGRDRVGVRIPDHPVALALLERFAPITATSANPSGEPGTHDPAALAPAIRDGVAAVLPPYLDDLDAEGSPDADGPVEGGREPSTVVDVERSVIHRRGAIANAVETFLREQLPE
jgi:L-threonylcarbamoyladenylate synthase